MKFIQNKAIIIGLFLCFFSLYAQASETVRLSNNTDEKEYAETLNQLFSVRNESEKTTQLMADWTNYVKNTTPHEINTYLSMFNSLDIQYYQAIIDAESCDRQNIEKKEPYSPKWIDDLQKSFNKEYIRKNHMAINACLLALYEKNHFNACRNANKQALYLEAVRTRAYVDFITLFIEYVSTLNESDRKLLSKRADAATKLNRLISEAPLTSLLSDSHYKTILMLKTAREKTDDKLYEFMMKSKFLSQPFDIMTAADDLSAYLKK